jgi:hypothetical protein
MLSHRDFRILFIFSYVSLFSQSKIIKPILSQSYGFAMISKDDNVPYFYPTADSLGEISVLLHKGYSTNVIRRYFNWDKNKMATKLDFLMKANFITKLSDGTYLPTVFVCTKKNETVLKQQIKKIAIQTADSIQKIAPVIEKSCGQMKAFKGLDFNAISLLILSDVLLDSWQIESVEKYFLKTERTLRHGKKYYGAYLEKNSNQDDAESFGIYGNQYNDTLNFSMCRYGNNRYASSVLLKNQSIKLSFIKNELIFECPVIDTSENNLLQTMANQFLPTLLSILNQNRSALEMNFLLSPYAKSVSFEEYFIWLYHVYYTAVTDELIKRKVITLPENGVSYYILKYD